MNRTRMIEAITLYITRNPNSAQQWTDIETLRTYNEAWSRAEYLRSRGCEVRGQRAVYFEDRAEFTFLPMF